ncbi:MAG: hypothetical protein IK084_01345, partial [Bacteroidaceae bacterium]|nr:hypothetical protein [Bacteroidaceae bacterium]
MAQKIDPEKAKRAQDYVFNGGAFDPLKGGGIEKVETRMDQKGRPAGPVEQSMNQAPYETGAMVDSKMLRDQDKTEATKRAESEVAAADRERKQEQLDAARAAYDKEYAANRKKVVNGMDASIKAGRGFREHETEMLKSGNEAWKKSASDGDPSLYYQMKHGVKGDDEENRLFGDRNEGRLGDMEHFAGTEKGRSIMRAMLKKAEADSARISEERAAKARQSIYSG